MTEMSLMPETAIINYVDVAEKYFQKKCLPDEVVHHIDGNRENNHPENLVIMKRSQHSRLHNGLMGALDKWREKTTRKLCCDCLYMRMYNKHRHTHQDLIIDQAISLFACGKKEMLVEDIERDKDKLLELCDEFYEKSKTWAEQNDHDCYAGKNMHVVKVSR